MKTKNLEIGVARILGKLAAELATAIEADVMSRVADALGGAIGGRRGRGARAAGAPKNIRPCRIPGCGKPSKGPRFRFLCEDHRGLSKGAVAKRLAAAGSSVVLPSAGRGAQNAAAGSASKAGAVKSVAAKRSAAKPGRKAAGKAKGGAGIKPCRIPGCGKPSKGPRFQFLCADHRTLPKAEVAKLLERRAS